MENSKVTIRKLTKNEQKEFLIQFPKAPLITKSIIFAVVLNRKFIGGITINKSPIAISYLYILPEYRNLGHGTKLVEYSLTKYRSITLTTGSRTDAAAHHIYSKIGFKIIGRNGLVTYWIWEQKAIESVTDFDFYCKPHNCKMLKSACVKRQKLARVPGSFQNNPAYTQGGCDTCTEGVDIGPLKNEYTKHEVLNSL